VIKRDVSLENTPLVTVSGTYEPFGSSRVTVTGIPSWIGAMATTQAVLSHGRLMWWVFSPQFPPEPQVINGVATVAHDMPLPRDGMNMVALTPTDQFGTMIGGDRILAWGPATATRTLDYSALMLREVTSRPAYDPTSTTVEWTESATGRTANTVMSSGYWGNVSWYAISARGDQPLIRLPLLPVPALAAPATMTVYLTSLWIDGGYPRVRERLLGQWSSGSSGAWPIDDAPGLVVYQDLQSVLPD
jgi:hypothetical protein